MPRAKKVWLKAACWVTASTLEVAQSAFVEANAIGIEVDDGILPEGRRKYSDDRIVVTAYFEKDSVILSELQEYIATFFTACGFTVPTIEFTDFNEEDWQGNFVKSCTTFKVEPNIFIVPSFEIDAFKQQPRGELFIEMDPENAFGTGQHQTTKLCLTALHTLLNKPQQEVASKICLDVGTGSGILAILIKKLGVASVLATETDEDALETAARNATKNGVSLTFLHVTETHAYEADRFDLVVANILAPVLIAMASNLSTCIASEGELVLSGILLSQAPAVIDAYGACGLTFVQQTSMDDWCALVFRRA